MRILTLFWLTAGVLLLLFTRRVNAFSGFKYASNVPAAIDVEPLGDETAPPDPPRNVRCVASSHSAILYWDHPSTKNRIKVRGYSVEWGIGAPNAKADVQGAETSLSINELRPNTTYTFSIFAFNDFGDSEIVEITATTTPAERRDVDLVFLQAPKIVSIRILSTTSIEVHWKDPNVDYTFENGAESLERKKIYFIKYGIDKIRIFNEISSTTPAAIISNLKPGYVYRIMVKVVVDGVNSLWSTGDTIEIPSRALILGKEIFNIECDFEDLDQCHFHNEKQNLLQWSRVSPRPEKKHPPNHYGQESGHYMLLKSVDHELEERSTLTSNSFAVQNGIYLCISFWIYSKKSTKGSFLVNLKNDEEKNNAATCIYSERFERFERNVWQHIFINLDSPRHNFKLSFEVRKERGKSIWIALDDVAIKCGRCPRDSYKFSKYINNRKEIR